MSNFEQTLSIIKPDAVERNLVEEIKRIFTSNNLKIKESKKIQISKEEAAEFYKVHQSKPFYENLCSYLSSGPIVAMILEGENAVSSNRKLMGATDPKKAEDKKIHITKEEAAEFYKVHQTKPFYDDLCSYLSSGPIVVMVLEGENAISFNRELMGSTDPKQAKENTIRKLYGISIDKNSVHGSDSSDNAKKEINFFFKS